MEYLKNYYDNYDEELRLSSKHGQVEFLTTMRYIEKYLKKGMRVIEIGAGTGRYSRALADKGFLVDSIELCDKNIATFRSLVTPKQNINIIKANALDLNFIEEEKYDITLLLGPLYHLVNEGDKKQCLSQALRITKTGGILFAAYLLSDASILEGGFKRRAFDIVDYIAKGKINPHSWDTFSTEDDIFELVRKEDIDKLNEGFAIKRLHFVAADLMARHMRETLNDMSQKEFELFLNYHFALCERADMTGLSHHVIDILKKEA